jgi:hypothetical protein
LLAGWTALAVAAAPLAQTAPPSGPAPAPASAPGAADAPTTVKDVTVTARRPPLKDLPRAVSQFVRSHGAPSRRTDEQIARWGDPICVITLGLNPAFNAFVTRRVQEVAASVGAPLAKSKPGEPCARNIEILFADDPQAVALAAFKRNDALMGYHYAAEVRDLSKFEPPIKAWYATGSRARGHLVIDSIWTLAPSGGVASRLSAGVSSEFMNILVIADRKTVIGYEIGPISDYMAMLVLTQPRSLTACDPLPSILDLMSANCSDEDKPKTLTPVDLAYLRALYAAPSDQNIHMQRDAIWDRMQRELTAAPKP